jgi:anti-sigma regulatory factor (Ser/Thr protein kinase)
MAGFRSEGGNFALEPMPLRPMTRFAADIAPTAQSISKLTDDAASFLRSAGVDARAVHHVSLVLEELLTNIMYYGAGSDLPASVAVTVEPDRISGEIGDWGQPFDPRDAPPPDLTATLEDRKIGGLGVHLVRHLTAALDYRRDGDRNRTTFCVLRGQ